MCFLAEKINFQRSSLRNDIIRVIADWLKWWHKCFLRRRGILHEKTANQDVNLSAAGQPLAAQRSCF